MDAMKADVRNGCDDFNFNMFSDRAAAAYISLPSNATGLLQAL